MNASPAAFVAVLTLLALAACGPADKTITAADLPHVRMGLWEEISGVDHTPLGWSRDCSDGALHLPSALMPPGCATQPVMKRTPAGVILVDWDCTGTDGATTNLRTTVSGDFNSSYAIESTTSTRGGGAPPRVSGLKDTYRFIGDCTTEVMPTPSLSDTD